MSDQRDGGIAWTDESWNPVRGCSRVSAGCTSCYAERVAARFGGPGLPYEGLARRTESGDARWTGKVVLVPEHLSDPLRWRRPRRVFVNSMSDLFHESLTNEQIAAVFGVMAASPRHTFQVLTKRARRMREWFGWALGFGELRSDALQRMRFHADQKGARGIPLTDVHANGVDWPLANVWIGVSAENQATWNDRVPELLGTPAAIRWVSYEPAIGPIDMSACIGGAYVAAPGDVVVPSYNFGLDWIVVGGESGPGARPFDLAWARSTIAACKAAGVACFVKQLGAQPMQSGADAEEHGSLASLRARAGRDMAEWPADLRVREWPR